jgi:hypothetical protein
MIQSAGDGASHETLCPILPMNFPTGVSGPVLGIGLVIASQVAAWLVGLVRGGFKVGRLAKTIELSVGKDQLPAFVETAHRRLEELGFRPGESAGQFIQSGAVPGVLASFTHAKTKKALTLKVSDGAATEARVGLTLLYLDPILGDTGESAYRDAVLAYVSGQAQTMITVVNSSFAAFSCLTGGLLAWVAVLYLKAAGYHPLWMPLTIVAITDILTGFMAIQAIARRPSELTGTREAILGMILAATAAAFAVAYSAQTTPVSPPPA